MQFRTRTSELLLAIVLASGIVPAFPQLLEQLRLARQLRPLSIHARRERLMPDYKAIEKIRAQVPMTETIALIGASREARDEAVFLNYYLYPHRTRTFHSRWEYLAARDQSKVFVRLDSSPEVTTYAGLRSDEVRRTRIVRDMPLSPQANTDFVVPIVTSADGPPPVVYTVEGALAADRETHVTLTLEPDNILKILTIFGTRVFNDLVHECFGIMEFAAWVHVKSDVPVRAAFWLVNRTARTAAPIHLIEGPLTRPVPFPVDPTVSMWLLNLGDDSTIAHVGTATALLPPHGLIATHAEGTVTGRVYAFTSKKDPNGQTQFAWPEDLK